MNTKEDIDKDNIFDVWANLNSGVLITIETWNQDGERGYNSVKCYVPVNGALRCANRPVFPMAAVI